MSFKERIEKLSKYKIAISFLALEVFAFIAFSFGSSFILFGALSLALAILLAIFYFNDLRNDNTFRVLFFIFPIILFSLITAFGPYMRGHYGIGDFSLAELIFLPLGLISICFSGYVLAISKVFKLKYLLIVIYSALAVLSLINLFANLINFGAFYPLLYKGYYLYYGGLRSSLPVDKMAYALEGFKIIEVNVDHYALYPGLLLSSAFMLIKTSIKNEKKLFFIYSSFLLVGLLSLILVPTTYSLIMIVIGILAFGVAFIMDRFEKSRKPINIVVKIGLIAAAFILFIMILNNQSFLSEFSNFISGNSVLNRLFNENRFASKYNIMLTNVIGENFLGFAAYRIGALLPQEAHLTGSILFDTFMTSGVIGVICLTAFIFLGIKSFYKFLVQEKDEYRNKIIMLLFVLVFLAYSMMFNDGEYGVYYTIRKPVYMSGPFMISLFILTFSYGSSLFYKKEEVGQKVESEVTTDEN